MNKCLTTVTLATIALVASSLFSTVTAAELFGRVVSPDTMTVSQDGLDIRVPRGQHHLVFVGDRLVTGDAEGAMLTVTGVAEIRLDASSTASLGLKDGVYQLHLERGTLLYRLEPHAQLTVTVDGETLSLTESSGVIIAQTDTATQTLHLAGADMLTYQGIGNHDAELLAQVGAGTGTAAVDAGTAAGGVTATTVAVVAGFAATGVLVTQVIRTDRDDAPPASPVNGWLAQ